MRRPIIGAAAVAAAVALVVAGRAESSRDVYSRNAEIARIQAIAHSGAAGPATAYRQSLGFGCLIYGTAKKPYGIDLCVDPEGRVVEAIDRRAAPVVHIGTLRFAPSDATNHEDVAAMVRLLRARDPKRYADVTSLPLGYDVGPMPFPAHP